MKKAYFLSHNGLGDNITNIGAVLFLLQYYDTIFFLCKDIYQSNVNEFFVNKSVITIPIDSSNEFYDCYRIIKNADLSDDIFISGCHKSYLSSRITCPEIVHYQKRDIPIMYEHIYMFYDDIGLDLSIYMDYFCIESNDQSKKAYDSIKDYSIVFLHTKGSNRRIQLTDVINKYKNKKEYLFICANENVYEETHPKYSISNQYVNKKIVDYIDIIYHSKEIHVIDSCFSCIVYPLLLSNKIKPDFYKIYDI